MNESIQSKAVSAIFLINDIRNDPMLCPIPNEGLEPSRIKSILLEKYKSPFGRMAARIEDGKILLEWIPEKVDDGAEMLHQEAMHFAKNKQYDKAILKWQQALLIHENDIEYAYKLGLLFYEQKKYTDSASYLEKAVRICPIHHKAHLVLGIDCIKLKRYDMAEKHFLESKRLQTAN
ncbi:MAG TPA: CDC27 family protein, partial [bacterium]